MYTREVRTRALVAFSAALIAVQHAVPAKGQTADSSKATAASPAALSSSLHGTALEDYEQAKLLYADQDYAGAALKFQSAYDQSQDPRLLWNLAAAEKNLRHYVRVEQLLTAYLQKSGPLASEAEREDGRALLATVRSFIAQLTLVVSEPGARVLVDDIELGVSPLTAPLKLDMGDRTLRVEKAGFVPFTAQRRLAGGSQTELDVKLVRELHQGTLQITTEAGATIFVDGKVVGKGKWRSKLPSGTHQLEVTAPGKEAWRLDAVVQDNQTRSLSVTLKIKPLVADRGGIPSWLWVGGGVVAAGLVGIGAYALLKPEDKGPPAATPGTFATVELAGLR